MDKLLNNKSIEQDPALNSFYHPRMRVMLDCGTETVTKQEFKDECDINTILNTFARTGQITHLNSMAGTWDDLPPTTDFQDAYNTVIQAQDAFAALPASIRDRYRNDPEQFLSALSNPNERDFLTEQGVFIPRPPLPVAPPPVAPSAGGA